jgi:hypothetical protein
LAAKRVTFRGESTDHGKDGAASMDQLVDGLSRDLAEAGWRGLGMQSHGGIDFELVGYRRFFFTKWRVLVRRLEHFDRPSAEAISRDFETLSSKSKSWWWGSCFLLCIVADRVESDLERAIRSDGFGVFGLLRLKGGGGRILIADLERKQVYGEVPVLPVDVHRFTKRAKKILEKISAAGVGLGTSITPATRP